MSAEPTHYLTAADVFDHLLQVLKASGTEAVVGDVRIRYHRTEDMVYGSVDTIMFRLANQEYLLDRYRRNKILFVVCIVEDLTITDFTITDVTITEQFPCSPVEATTLFVAIIRKHLLAIRKDS